MHVEPSAEVEDVDRRAIDATAIPCREDVVGAQEPVWEQQQPEPVVGESDALPGPHVGEEAKNIDAPGLGIDKVYVVGDSTAGCLHDTRIFNCECAGLYTCRDGGGGV